jgi:hypothetical protein
MELKEVADEIGWKKMLLKFIKKYKPIQELTLQSDIFWDSLRKKLGILTLF